MKVVFLLLGILALIVLMQFIVLALALAGTIEIAWWWTIVCTVWDIGCFWFCVHRTKQIIQINRRIRELERFRL